MNVKNECLDDGGKTSVLKVILNKNTLFSKCGLNSYSTDAGIFF